MEVRESGVWKASWTIAAGDLHKVAVDFGAVKYFQNGTLKHTRTLAPTYPLLVDTSLQTIGTAVQNAVIAGAGGGGGTPLPDTPPTVSITAPANGASVAWDSTTVPPGTHTLTAVATDTAGNATTSAPVTVTVSDSTPSPGGDVVWTSPVNVAVSGNTITKNAGCGGCADAGAISQQTIASGNGGGVQFTVSSGMTGTVGLSTGNPGTSGSEIKFGLRLLVDTSLNGLGSAVQGAVLTP